MFYFVSYAIGKSEEIDSWKYDFRCISINEHPFDWVKKVNEQAENGFKFVILFYKEISEEDFDKCQNVYP